MFIPLATILLLSTSATTSFGATLATDAVFAFGTGGAMSCLLTNVSTKPVTIDVEEFDTSDLVTHSLASGTVVAPNGTFSQAAAGVSFGFCRFTLVKGGGKASVRAYACATSTGHDGCVDASAAR